MKRLILLVVGAVVPLFTFAAAGINLSDALNKGTVKIDAVTTAGRYTGRSLKLTITNTGNAAVEIKVNTGIILRPSDASYQQLVLPGGEKLELKAHEAGEVEVEVFCDNAIKLCPVAGLHYSYYRICGEELMQVLEYVRDHSYYDRLGQAAVWSISNYLSLHCVYDRSRAVESEKLIAHIVAVTHREKPTYYTTYTDDEMPGQRAYVGKADRVYVPFEMNLSTPKVFVMALYNARGEFVKNISDPQVAETGKRIITAQIVPAEVESGKYSVRMMEGEKLLHERTVLVERWILFKG